MNTPFVSTLYFRSDSQDACSYLGNVTTSNSRPITHFTMCSAEPDPANFVYSWQTTNDPVDNPVSDSTFAVITSNGDFEVLVTNLVGGCVDSTITSIVAECCGIDEVIIDDVICHGEASGGLIIIPYSNNPTTSVSYTHLTLPTTSRV